MRGFVFSSIVHSDACSGRATPSSLNWALATWSCSSPLCIDTYVPRGRSEGVSNAMPHMSLNDFVKLIVYSICCRYRCRTDTTNVFFSFPRIH
ncbi:hypothetical protein BD309DRAFT_701601 [Dichomitus squalens]|nr:hypothetical protein BD309DRAFT_701601 [Dichomitus squalens]